MTEPQPVASTEVTPDPAQASQPVEVSPAEPERVEADQDNPTDEAFTAFDEDDNPQSLAGDFLDEDGDGVDDRKGDV